VAQKTTITDRALLEAVARHRGGAGRSDAGTLSSVPLTTPPSAEEQLISIGLNHSAWRAEIASGMTPEDVRDPILRRIFTEFIQAETPGGSQETPRPMSVYPPEVQRRLSSLWARDPWSTLSRGSGDLRSAEEGHEALRRTVADCLARVRQGRTAGQLQALRQAVAAADRCGDQEQILRLLAEHPSVKRGREKT
jgi:hypothetical protein